MWEAFKQKKIGVLTGGMSSEKEISRMSADAVLKALKELGYNAILIDISSNVTELLQQNNIEVAFIALHGAPGEDGTIQGLLEVSRIPYTGSGVLSSALSINKVISKKIFCYHGLPTPVFQSFCPDKDEADNLENQITIPLPFVIKPSNEGSTIGISVVSKKERISDGLKKALQHDSEIMIEEFINGREITAGVLNGQALPLVEIRPKSGFYDYKSKYTSGETEYIVSPDLDKGITDRIMKTAAQAFGFLGCRGAARVDFMLSNSGSPFILEVNTIPGMTQTSLLPMAAGQAGIDFQSLVEKILWEAALNKNRKLKNCKQPL